uniref:Uncharacterized protein n=1 Tax=Chromera velia CCMP2878 TaxID=1169474 RepID=A0A0G4GUH3_9ALVE|eukprot:Cvel_23426.t1-p1 / transcript=Cvel_23426.t1 / gene=Cvel_23426 / organism=Chromera_velia_CCMP2878 / gene_product=hypothetical protein / transcript_product=hypothetical protein / location=Cvel_scaffold2413:8053-8511(-) / protein_length=116 / sequence_SO=supercontig / SO=protein_coding / is_pseudo=false
MQLIHGAPVRIAFSGVQSSSTMNTTQSRCPSTLMDARTTCVYGWRVDWLRTSAYTRQAGRVRITHWFTPTIDLMRGIRLSSTSSSPAGFTSSALASSLFGFSPNALQRAYVFMPSQ